MDDIELFVLTLFYAGYTKDYIKTIANTDNIDHLINKFNNFELLDNKKTITLY